jgi:hypothetical protein
VDVGSLGCPSLGLDAGALGSVPLAALAGFGNRFRSQEVRADHCRAAGIAGCDSFLSHLHVPAKAAKHIDVVA